MTQTTEELNEILRMVLESVNVVSRHLRIINYFMAEVLLLLNINSRII
jgi:hypothetical protein